MSRDADLGGADWFSTRQLSAFPESAPLFSRYVFIGTVWSTLLHAGFAHWQQRTGRHTKGILDMRVK
jgi:hypothetical protein